MAANIEPVLTIADLDAMPDDGNRYELIEGELFVSRAPALKHQRIVRNFLHKIQSYLDLNPIGEVLPGPGVIFSEFSGLIPDLVYMSNKRRPEIETGERLEGAPELTIEILSPGLENERRDRKVKRQLYHKYGVKEYWIVDSKKSTIEIYHAPGFKLQTTLKSQDELTTSLLPGFRCPVNDLFITSVSPCKTSRIKQKK